jgi:hypothetical protein
MSGFNESKQDQGSVPNVSALIGTQSGELQSGGRNQTKKSRNIRGFASNQNISQARIRQLLDYCPSSGIFVRKEKTGCKGLLGAEVGHAGTNGYVWLQIDNIRISAHRAAWLWWYGYLPETDVDHIDKDPSNNRIENLRCLSHVCNMRNSKLSKANKSGIKGVYWIKERGKWGAALTISAVNRQLGRWRDLEEAVAHRLAAEQCLGWEGCDSSTPAFKFIENWRRRNEHQGSDRCNRNEL